MFLVVSFAFFFLRLRHYMIFIIFLIFGVFVSASALMLWTLLLVSIPAFVATNTMICNCRAHVFRKRANINSCKPQTKYTFINNINNSSSPSTMPVYTAVIPTVADRISTVSLQMSSYSLGLDENLPAGTEVAVLEAFDRDSAPFNRFFFQFRSDGGPGMDAFNIDNVTGRVTTSRVLDREQQEVWSTTTTTTTTAGVSPVTEE